MDKILLQSVFLLFCWYNKNLPADFLGKYLRHIRELKHLNIFDLVAIYLNLRLLTTEMQL